MTVVEYSGKGLREDNQDYVKSCSLPKEGATICVVADGMGGYSYGSEAAKTVAEAIVDYVEENCSRQKPATLLKGAFSFANESLCLKKIALGAREMGCVVAVLLMLGETAYLAWLGDSRIYIYRDQRELFRTTDHSMTEELSRIKPLSAADYERYSHIVTRSIMGDDEDVTPSLAKCELFPGDRLLLCTDGLYRQISIPALMGESPQTLKSTLDAYSNTTEDNYSCILLQV
ncbi:MAG: protein phosphatase 2C domain-containing protein [Bacteroidales bacterium]|nr:protein phosphatase 2C domain-containing protein [Bacteroidales bacterium]MCD8393528.1 protein phosphatase 2C domain-containing protein [Bacteroidales bacterium]